MKRFLPTILTMTVSLASLGQEEGKVNNFKIMGAVTGFTDSTLIFLSDLTSGGYKDIDSTLILNGKFLFRGTLNDNVVMFGIHTKGFADRVAFWVDHSETTIDAEKGKFKMARIKGSKAQEKKYELDAISDSSKSKKRDYIKFIQNNPASIVSADLLNLFRTSWNKDTVSMLYNQLSETAKNTIYAKNVFEALLLNKSPKIGDQYVDFAEQNMDGKMIKLSDFQGKIVLLEFWGSWCLPCIEGHPALIKTYNKFKDRGFEILGVAADVDRKTLVEAIRKDGLPWQNVSDLRGDQNKAVLIYGISYYPANFLIDKNGVIVARDLRGEKLEEKLNELLN